MFVGCNEPLLGNVRPRSDYHGSDGFGDAPDSNAPDDTHLQSEHAVQALLRMSKEHNGLYRDMFKVYTDNIIPVLF